MDLFCLASDKDVDLVTDGCDKNKHIRVVFLFPVIRKSTKGTSVRYRYLTSNVTVTVDFLHILEDVACSCSCGLFFQFSIFFLKLTKLFLKSFNLMRNFLELRGFQGCCDCFQSIFLFTVSFKGLFTSHCQDTTSS